MMTTTMIIVERKDNAKYYFPSVKGTGLPTVVRYWTLHVTGTTLVCPTHAYGTLRLTPA